MPTYVELKIKPCIVTAAEEAVKGHTFDKEDLSKFGSEEGRTVEGMIGQFMVADFLGVPFRRGSYDYDIVYRGKLLEVKTISTKMYPLQSYEATVNSCWENEVHKQTADYFVFTRILFNHDKGWIVGFIRCDKFWEVGRFVRRGEEVYPGQVFHKADATMVEISKLHCFMDLVEHLNKGVDRPQDSPNDEAPPIMRQLSLF
jgi:hypothetical protein